MDVFSKIKSTVSGALPGNPVTRDFEVLTLQGSGGPCYQWKIHAAVKKSTKENAAVWIFDKKLVEKYSKPDREIVISIIKRGVSQLTKLRHPKILSVMHPLEESRDSLAFVTEPVFSSLGNILGDHTNLSSNIPSNLQNFKLFPVEVKYGLLQITEGLTFLHNSAKLVHFALSPSSIILNKNGAWKLFGFDFSIPNSNSNDQEPFWACPEWRSSLPPIAQPPLNFTSPESILQQASSPASDMYSLGILFYALHNEGKTPYDCRDNLDGFRSNIEKLRTIRNSISHDLPEEIREQVKMLLNTEPTLRPDADQMSKVPYFEDVGVMTLQYLDSLFQRDNLEKSKFFKGLPQIINQMPLRVQLNRVIPCIAKEFSNPNMVPFVLPTTLSVAEKSSDKEYMELIWPDLKAVFSLRDPVQISLIFLQNMNLLLSKTSSVEIRDVVLPMVYRCLEGNAAQIQELCLEILPTFANLVEYNSIKNHVIPRIRKLALQTSILSVRVNCLICIGKIMEYMDKWYVLDDIFPILTEIPSREPAVLMSMLGIYKVALTHKKLGITKDIMANRVLPFIIPLSIDNSLNLNQFNAFMSIIRDMLNKVEDEHRVKLEQIKSIQDEQRGLDFKHHAANNVKSEENKQNNGNTLMDGFMSTFNGNGTENTNNKASTKNFSNSKPQLTMEEKLKLTRQTEQKNLYAENSSTQLKPLNNLNQSVTAQKASTVKDLSSQLQDSLISPISQAQNRSMTPNTMPMTPQSMPMTPQSLPMTPRSVPMIPQSRPVSSRPTKTNPFLQPRNAPSSFQPQATSQQANPLQPISPMMNFSYRPNIPVTPPNPIYSNLQMSKQNTPGTNNAGKSNDKTANDELQDIFG
ncbi:DgyrCDS14167 [Dimorphilus gyrociliatus]|uniref:DgyrCDS14167 n=1 Tax=Dimorphilus gyrociliatus TaxID=2664684 RepID=A0A7I8WCV6_9ANNE|nr:DgyrCDS14167 [Dimorphilus gyrociliatus]